jgi:hypothetical protein
MKENEYIQTGWYDTRLEKGYRTEEKYSLIDKLKLFFGYDARKTKWEKVLSIPMTYTQTFNGKEFKTSGVMVLYKNGLGEEKAEAYTDNIIRTVPLEWAKSEIANSAVVNRF